MSAVRQRRYDSVEMKPLAGSADDDDEYEEPKSKTDQWLTYALHKLHALLWIVVASALTMWTQLPEVVMQGHAPKRPDRELNRCEAATIAAHHHTALRVPPPPNALPCALRSRASGSSSTWGLLASGVGCAWPRT